MSRSSGNHALLQLRGFKKPSVVLWLLLSSCAPGGLKVEPIDQEGESPPYKWGSLTGIRDGDILETNAVLVSGQKNLKMTMRFRIGVPTNLEWGRFLWLKEGEISKGTITERSVTFLGGQSDQPSIGGIFELIPDEGSIRYKVRLPTRQLTRPCPASP